MIVRTTPEALFLITQPDHAALSRRVMERWTPLHDVPRRASILLAIEQHDNGWAEADAAPMVDAGGVLDFIAVPAEVRQAVWPRGVRRLADDDPWAAALVAHHAVTVYERFRQDESWTAFFRDMEGMRDTLTARIGRSRPDIDLDYPFVRIGDLISLVFCNRWREPQAFAEWNFSLAHDHVRVTPDSFGGVVAPIAIPARQIPNRPFASDAALHAAIRTAPVVVLTGTCGA